MQPGDGWLRDTMGNLKDKARHYSEAFGGAQVLADPAARTRKAEKIKAVLRQEGILPNQNLSVLDIGCSFGFILKGLVPDVGYGVGTDIDRSAMKATAENLAYVCADGEHLPFACDSFDVVICNHVYEHTDSPEQMLAEIERILAPTGVCYFAGPNKYDLVEPHYGLLFLSWLPRALADFYLRVARRGEAYTEKPYSYAALRQLLSRFEITDYTAKIVADPVRYCAADILPPGSLKQSVARILLRIAPTLFPGFIFVLRKANRV